MSGVYRQRSDLDRGINELMAYEDGEVFRPGEDSYSGDSPIGYYDNGRVYQSERNRELGRASAYYHTPYEIGELYRSHSDMMDRRRADFYFRGGAIYRSYSDADDQRHAVLYYDGDDDGAAAAVFLGQLL